MVGIVSFSYGCATENFWGVYTDVAKSMDFINSVLTDMTDLNTVKLMCDGDGKSNECIKIENSG